MGINSGSIERYLNATFPRKYERLIELSDKLGVTVEWLATGRGTKSILVDELSMLDADAQIAMIRVIFLMAEPTTIDEITVVLKAHQPLEDRHEFLIDIEKVWNASILVEHGTEQSMAA